MGIFSRMVGWIENSWAWRRFRAQKAVLENETIDPAPRSAWAWLEIFVVACFVLAIYGGACAYLGRQHGRVHEVVRVQEKAVAIVPEGLVSVKALEAWKDKSKQCEKDLFTATNELIGRDPPSPPLGKAPKLSVMPLLAPGALAVEDVPAPVAAAKPKQQHWPKPCAKDDGWCDLSKTMSKAVKSVQKSVGAN